MEAETLWLNEIEQHALKAKADGELVQMQPDSLLWLVKRAREVKTHTKRGLSGAIRAAVADSALTTREIADTVGPQFGLEGASAIYSINAALQALYRRGKIERVARGAYRAKAVR